MVGEGNSEIIADGAIPGDVLEMRPRRIASRVAYPLWCARTSRELVQALFDALTALRGVTDSGFLHQDITIGNVMIAKNGPGVLTDCDYGHSVPRRPSREDQGFTGPPVRLATRQFMSIRILQDPKAQHTLKDDVESSFWVLLWVALKRFEHQWEPGWCFELFNQELPKKDKDRPGPPTMTGGDFKHLFVLARNAEDLGFVSRPLDDLIQQVAKAFYELYSIKRPDEAPEEYRAALARCGVDGVLQLFRTALDREDWPSVLDRAAADYYRKERPNVLAKKAAQASAHSLGLWVTGKDGTQSFCSMPSRQRS